MVKRPVSAPVLLGQSPCWRLLAGVALLAPAPAARRPSGAAKSRNNNTYEKLLECVTLEGVRDHQAALQAIATANGGNRAAGTSGYDASVDYVVKTLRRPAGASASTCSTSRSRSRSSSTRRRPPSRTRWAA